MKQRQRALRRLNFTYGQDKAFHVKVRRKPQGGSSKRESKNARNANIKLREKFGTRVLNLVKEALLLDKLNNNTKWQDTIEKELKALDKLKV